MNKLYLTLLIITKCTYLQNFQSNTIEPDDIIIAFQEFHKLLEDSIAKKEPSSENNSPKRTKSLSPKSKQMRKEELLEALRNYTFPIN